MAESMIGDLILLSEDVETILSESLPQASGEEKIQLARQADHKLQEAEELLERAELEVKNCPQEERGKFLKQIRSLQHQFDLLQQRVNRERHAAHASTLGHRDSESEDEGSYAVAGQDPTRRQLLSQQERLDRSSERVRNATRIALETENIGAGVLDDLHSQRDTILNIGASLDGTDSRLAQTRRTLRSMAMRAMQMKAVWYLIGGALLGIILLLIYIGVR